jgi:hypothetical protein
LGFWAGYSRITDALEGIVQAIAEPIDRARPTKATVKFGMELTVCTVKLSIDGLRKHGYNGFSSDEEGGRADDEALFCQL